MLQEQLLSFVCIQISQLSLASAVRYDGSAVTAARYRGTTVGTAVPQWASVLFLVGHGCVRIRIFSPGECGSVTEIVDVAISVTVAESARVIVNYLYVTR